MTGDIDTMRARLAEIQSLAGTEEAVVPSTSPVETEAEPAPVQAPQEQAPEEPAQ